MLVLGHLGFSLLGGWLFHRATSRAVPLGWLVLGAFLPDLIDKPLGHYILDWGNGRLWGHTLALLLLLGALAWATRSRAVGTVSGGTLLHHLEDGLPWSDPESWLWPLMGPFRRGTHAGLADWWGALMRDPFVQATEVLGLLLVIALVAGPWLRLWGRRWWENHGRGEESGTLQA